MKIDVPRLIVAGLSGDSGKTVVSLSLVSALRRQRTAISVFKKGPDYIDAAWLAFAADSPCRNLDTFLVPEAAVRESFVRHARGADVAIIEGNRGLYDGKDVSGTHSTAGLAKLLHAPLVLVVDATKVTRTVAALVKGCQVFDPEVNIAGVVLNRVAGERHRQVLADAVTEYCGIPVLGSIPKLSQEESVIPGRHLGLVPPAEFAGRAELRERLESIADEYINLEMLREIAQSAPGIVCEESSAMAAPEPRVRIGFFRDSVFTFYYPENLEGLRAAGAELTPISSLTDHVLPDIDALYIGGGFPETHGERLAANTSLKESLRKKAEAGLPIYAECGGLIFLCRSLTWQNRTYPMAGVFDVDLHIQDRPAGHGYVEATVEQANAFFRTGMKIRGHEFHYSRPSSPLPKATGCLGLNRGVGLGNGRDGLTFKKTLASYTHIHSDGVPEWAAALVANAGEYKNTREENEATGTPLADNEGRGGRNNIDNVYNERVAAWPR